MNRWSCEKKKGRKQRQISRAEEYYIFILRLFDNFSFQHLDQEIEDVSDFVRALHQEKSEKSTNIRNKNWVVTTSVGDFTGANRA